MVDHYRLYRATGPSPKRVECDRVDADA
jgi:hypothetical protein